MGMTANLLKVSKEKLAEVQSDPSLIGALMMDTIQGNHNKELSFLLQVLGRLPASLPCLCRKTVFPGFPWNSADAGFGTNWLLETVRTHRPLSTAGGRTP